MSEILFLEYLLIILSISAVVVFALHRIKIPSIIGFLLAGMLIGPHGFHLIQDSSTINTLAEIGVVLLLFTIGLEFPLSRFLKMRSEVFGTGGLQVASTVILTALAAYNWFGVGNINTAVFLGFLVALSSTAIVMKLLSEKGELNSPHGRSSIGALIFQDLCVVPFMLFIPILSGGGIFTEMAMAIIKAAAIIAAVLFLSRWLVPGLLYQIVRTRSRELFVISILIICFGIALLTSEFGLSLALGAFLAGIVISESEYVHETTSTILPFRDSFSGLFFISVGMLMDRSFFVEHIVLVLLVAGGIIILKFISSFLAMYLMKRPLRVAIQSGMDMAQVGEFSFVLAIAGLSAGLISDYIYNGFLSAAVLTMLIAPLIMKISSYVSVRMTAVRHIKKFERVRDLSEHEEDAKRSGHVIIAGFGLNGRNLASVLKSADIPYVILELNIATVREMKQQGEPIFFGDGTKLETLIWLGVKTAKVLAIVISDPASCRNIVKVARGENPDLFIIARTGFTAEVDELSRLGANEVIPDEFETSVEIFSKVLAKYNMPKNEIFDFADKIREDSYKALRQDNTTTRKPLFEKNPVLSDITVDHCAINETSPLSGRSIEDMKFRTRTGATIIAVERDKKMHTNPEPGFILKAGDIAFFIGKKEDINKALVYIADGRE